MYDQLQPPLQFCQIAPFFGLSVAEFKCHPKIPFYGRSLCDIPATIAEWIIPTSTTTKTILGTYLTFCPPGYD